MRILFLNRSAAPLQGEMNQYVLDVLQRLRAAGETVALVHSRTPKAEFGGTRYVFDHLDEMHADPRDVRLRLEAIVEDFQPDVAQIHGVANTTLDTWLAPKVPTVRFIHNHRYYCSGENMTWRRPRRMCELPHARPCLSHHYINGCGHLNPVHNALNFRRVSKALRDFRVLSHLQVASRMIRENLMRNGFDPRRVEVLPLYAPEPIQKPVPSPALGRTVLHPGGLVPNKGVWLMAKGIDLLPPDVGLIFGGSGPLQGELERYAKNRELSARIRIIGELDPAQWSQVYHQADLVVLPSMWNEPLGLAGMHAMAHGKPVIAFHSAGVNEWLRHGITGYGVPFGDRKAFLARVAETLSHPVELATMGEAGRKIWEENFRPSHHLDRLRDFYRRITRRPTPS